MQYLTYMTQNVIFENKEQTNPYSEHIYSLMIIYLIICPLNGDLKEFTKCFLLGVKSFLQRILLIT